MELSVARAFAIRVFEHPGGPYSNTPLGGGRPSEANRSGYSSGHSTTCINEDIIHDMMTAKYDKKMESQ